MKKIIIRLLIILLIILALIGIAFFGYSLYQKEQNKEIRSNFYKYILGNNFEKIFDYSLEENIINKIKSENYNSKTKIEFSNSFKNDYNIDIDKFTIESDLQSNNTNQKNIISFDYSNNELFNLDIIQNDKYIGVKNQDILNNYVGIKKENAKRIFEKINPNINMFYNNLENYNIVKTLKTNGNSIFSKSNNDYLSNIEKYIKSNKFVEEENVILKQDNGNVEVNANKYSLTITKQEFLNVYSVLTNMMVEDEDFINHREKILAFNGIKMK